MKRIVYKLLRNIEKFVKDKMYSDFHEKSLFDKLFRILSFPFFIIIYLREKIYANRLISSCNLGCFVIVVGNLTVGGTGKTPVVEKLAKILSSEKRKVAILSRGYKSKGESLFKKFLHWLLHSNCIPPKVVSDGLKCLLPFEMSGDEPLQLAKNLPGVCVLVDKDRIKSGKYAINRLHCNTLILDDGYQYFKLKGVLNLLLIDATNPFGNGYVLPGGILRESLKCINRANFIFLTKTNYVDPNRVAALTRIVQKFNKKAKIFQCTHEAKYLQVVDGNEKVDLFFLKNKKIAIFSGIAVPMSFKKTLLKYEPFIVYSEHFLDHHHYKREELENFFANAKKFEAEFVVTTEKDMVRIPETWKFDMKLYFLRIEIGYNGASDPFKYVIDSIVRIKV